MLTQINTTPGSVNTLSTTADYQADPLAVFQTLCQKRTNTLLLESAEIDKKHQLKSLLLTDAAVKVVCNGQSVTLDALTLNGQSALTFIKSTLESKAELTAESATQLAFTFEQAANNLDEKSRLKVPNPFEVLRVLTSLESEANHPFAVFLGGAFAFDMMTIAECLPAVKDGENTCPDYVFYLAETLVVIDHEKRSSEVIGNVFSGEEQQKSYFEISRRLAEIKNSLANEIVFQENDHQDAIDSTINTDQSDEAFCQTVEKLKENICKGDIFQAVPSRTFTINCPDSITAYQELKRSNPSPYMFYLQDDDFVMFGASPESALKYQESNRQVELYPIAGTRKRGKSADGSINLDLDSRIELELRQDQKELAEHTMLVDLARNDIARISAPGTRYVADLLKVDRYSHVMHLVSRVCGKLSDDLDALHAYQACMNMGTLSGAPKVMATSLIREVEGKRRGSYGGAVGYLTGTGEMDTCIVIRSAFVKEDKAYVQAGAGVVFDSVPQAEADETRQKAQAVLSAITAANQRISA